MSELNNTVVVQGNYNNIPTQITSNTSVVNIIEGLTLSITADKQNWVSDNLTYTITLENNAELTYTTAVITDIIDTDLVTFIDGSVEIDDAKAQPSEYNYNADTKTLTITLGDVPKDTTKKILFKVKKKIRQAFQASE